MCSAHLIPSQVVFDAAPERTRCSSCRKSINKSQAMIVVDGRLDAGTRRRYTFRYHPTCYELLDVTDLVDGCFSYGVPT